MGRWCRGEALGLALVAVLGTACAEPQAIPTWTLLAELPEVRAHAREASSRSLELDLPSEVWSGAGAPGLFWTADPFLGTPLFLDRSEGFRLTTGDEVFALAPHVTIKSMALEPPGPGSFFFFRSRLYLKLEEERALPAGLKLTATVRAQEEAGGRARVLARTFSGDGFSLEHGEALRVSLPPGAPGRLEFAWCAVVLPGAVAVEAAELVVTERAAGERTRTFVIALDAGAAWANERFELGAVPGARELSFELRAEGRTALVAAPRVSPLAERAERGTAPPNLVLFVADTLRADALGAYGGERGVSPVLDEIAAGGAVFERAWSPSSWTLPAHASLFTGVFPYQHGARRRGTRLGPDLVTLAERLRDAGYRTGGVTDGLFLSHRFGLDRGFETFVETQPVGLAQTQAGVRDFLDADDGRPFFLLVHSYHAHGPYEVASETLREHGERLEIEEPWDVLMKRAAEQLAESHGVDAGDAAGWIALFQEADGIPVDPDIAEGLHKIYLARVLELDGAIGDLRREFVERGLDARTNWVFTSDHGEAFGEHDTLFHGRGVWDEVLRIPMIVDGPGVLPRRASFGASLIDLPRTFCELAGVAPEASWLGRSLVSLDRDRPVFAFDCSQSTEPMAVGVQGDVKFAGPVKGIEGSALAYTYDLARDPGEQTNLVDGLDRDRSASWEELTGALRVLLIPAADAVDATLDPEAEAALRAMGYVGDE